jgi:hypothetical protein
MAEELDYTTPKAEKKPFPWLLVGGGVAAAGAVWWFFLRKSPEEEAKEEAEQTTKTGGKEFDTTGGEAGGAGGAAAGAAGKKKRSVIKPQDIAKMGLRAQSRFGPRQIAPMAPQIRAAFQASRASGGSRQAASYLPAQSTPITPPPAPSGGRRR